MLGFVFCRICGVPIAPFGPDECVRCELEKHVSRTRLREQVRAGHVPR